MFLDFLVLVARNAYTTICFSAGLFACDYFQTGLAWCSEDQRLEIRTKIQSKLEERYSLISPLMYDSPKNKRKLFSVKIFSIGYDQYFDYATLCESKDHVESINVSLQQAYDDFLNIVFDGFLEISQHWHTHYNAGIISICEEGINISSHNKLTALHRCIKRAENEEKGDAILNCLSTEKTRSTHAQYIKTIEALLDVHKSDRDSVCWHVSQIVTKHKNSNNLCDTHYLVKRIAEIPPQYRHVILRHSELYSTNNNAGKWLRILRQSNESEYYVRIMYKFIPFLDENSFWSIFSDYSHNGLSRYPRTHHAQTMPTEEHLNYAFELFHEQITGAYFLPRSIEANDTLRLYLTPWFPVFLVYKVRSCKALEQCCCITKIKEHLSLF